VGRILGLDYGRRRIGVAVSDPLGLIAQPITTWVGLSWGEVGEKVCSLMEAMEVDRVILGLPLTLRGEKGHMAREVEKFSIQLKRQISIPVILWDERLTSVQSQRVIHSMDGKPSRKKASVDLVAAVLLLQSYLDHIKISSERDQEEKD
jgi:putative Holliday junction resolvase